MKSKKVKGDVGIGDIFTITKNINVNDPLTVHPMKFEKRKFVCFIRSQTRYNNMQQWQLGSHLLPSIRFIRFCHSSGLKEAKQYWDIIKKELHSDILFEIKAINFGIFPNVNKDLLEYILLRDDVEYYPVKTKI